MTTARETANASQLITARESASASRPITARETASARQPTTARPIWQRTNRKPDLHAVRQPANHDTTDRNGPIGSGAPASGRPKRGRTVPPNPAAGYIPPFATSPQILIFEWAPSFKKKKRSPHRANTNFWVSALIQQQKTHTNMSPHHQSWRRVAVAHETSWSPNSSLTTHCETNGNKKKSS